MQSKYSVYVPTKSSPQRYGEVIAIVGASLENANRLTGESYLLTQNAPHKMYETRLQLNPNGVADAPFKVDLDFMIDLGLGAARSTVADLLNADFAKHEDWRLFASPFDFELADPRILAHAWMLDKWHNELNAIHEKSRCESLVEWLNTLRGLPTVKRSSSHDVP